MNIDWERTTIRKRNIEEGPDEGSIGPDRRCGFYHFMCNQHIAVLPAIFHLFIASENVLQHDKFAAIRATKTRGGGYGSEI